MLTFGILWLAAQGEAAVFISGLLGERLRGVVMGAANDLALTLRGEQAFAAVKATGVIGVSLLLGGFVIAAFGTAAGIRRLAVAGRR